jgi:cyclophilin family peptidyl-prolyl cis-trans isomerase
MNTRATLAIALALVAVSTAASAETPRKSTERVVFNTPAGDLVFVLYPDVAPRHVRHFLKLVAEGVYDSARFGRLEPGFVLQLFTAEDRRIPLTAQQRSLLVPQRAEFSDVPHRRGVLSMARLDNDPDSGCSSFSILLGPAPHLDGKYTVFGELERGTDVLEELCKVPVDGNRPKVALEVRKAVVVGSAADLDAMHLVAATPLAVPTELTSSTSSAPAPAVAGGLALIVACGIAAFALANRLPPRIQTSLVLIMVLVGAFFLLVLLTPAAQTSSLLAVAVFAGMLGTFKMMSRFENPA